MHKLVFSRRNSSFRFHIKSCFATDLIDKPNSKLKLKDSITRVDIIQQTLKDALVSPNILTVNTKVFRSKNESTQENTEKNKPKTQLLKSQEDFLRSITRLKDNEWTKALEILEGARERKVDSSEIYEEALQRCATASKWRTALDILEQMHGQEHLPLSEKALTTTLLCCANGSQNAPAAAVKLFQHMVRTGVPMQRVVYTTLLPALAQSGMYDEFLAVWAQLQCEPAAVRRLSSSQTAARLETLAVLGRVREAEVELAAALASVRPVKAPKLYAGLLRGLLSAGLCVDADSLVSRMDEAGVEAPTALLGRLLQTLLTNGLVDVALRRLRAMSDKRSDGPESLGSDSGAAAAITGDVWVQMIRTLASNEDWDAASLVADIASANRWGRRLHRVGPEEVASAHWLPDLFADLGRARQWRLALQLSEWTGPHLDVEISLQRTLCRCGRSDLAISRHSLILQSTPTLLGTSPETATQTHGDEEAVDWEDTHGLEARSGEEMDMDMNVHVDVDEDGDGVLCDYSPELSQSLTNALCVEDRWDEVVKLLTVLGEFSSSNGDKQDGLAARRQSIREGLPALFARAVGHTRSSSAGLGQTSRLLGVMSSLGLQPTWSCARHAIRALDDECRWAELIDLFSTRALCDGYQASNESMYRLVVRACDQEGRWADALHLLLELLKETRSLGNDDDDAVRVVAPVGGGSSAATDLAAVRQSVRGVGVGVGAVTSPKKKTATQTKTKTPIVSTASSSIPVSTTPTISAFIFGDVIRTLVKHGQSVEALQMASLMQSAGVRPTVPAFAGVLRSQTANPVLRGLLLRELMRAGMPSPAARQQSSGLGAGASGSTNTRPSASASTPFARQRRVRPTNGSAAS